MIGQDVAEAFSGRVQLRSCMLTVEVAETLA